MDQLACQITTDRQNLSQVVRDVVDDKLAEFGICSEDLPQQQQQQQHQKRQRRQENQGLPPSSSPSASALLSGRLEDEYLLARRSLHVWPVAASSVEALRAFATGYLKLTNEEFSSFGITSVTTRRQATGSKINNECVVVFDGISDRDAFKSHSPKLQPYQQHEAGIRLALPDHLLSTFKILEHEAYQIVRRRPGSRRSIKFDDRIRSLVLDVKLPEAAWVRLYPDQVVKAAKARKKERVPEASEILRLAGEPLPVEGLAVVEDDQNMEPNQE